MNTWDLINQIRQRVDEEVGTLIKRASLNVALCHPSSYAIGMSSLGYQTIYREIHLQAGANAERAFLPESIEDYRKRRVPIFTYESETPISEFPVVAFSIAYELEITGIFAMLDLSGIPLLRQERTEKHPLIIAGGQLTNSNPAILTPFVDLIILGEGEELIHTFLDASAVMRRSELLSYLSNRPGCYVPGLTPSFPLMAQVTKDCLPAYSQIITKNSVLPSMFFIEPERGCSRGCNYCIMRRTAKRNMRLVSPEKVLSLIPENARRVGLVGAAVTDHPRIKELVRNIVKDGREIGLSSLQADRLDEELVQLLANGGCRTLTTASDGASQRLRSLIGRKSTEQHLIRAAEFARRARLKRLKLYQIVGFPGETSDDIDELLRFAQELSQIISLSLSISPFVAKRNTPLDGAPFEPIQSLESKLSKIRQHLRRKVEVRPYSARWAWVEYMLSQGGESAGLAAMDAWRAGSGFASWKRAFIRREVKTFPQRAVSAGQRRSA